MDISRRTLIGTALAAPALIAGAAPAIAAERLPRSAPLFVAKVGLRARNADAMAKWYQHTLGLTRLATNGATVILGAGDTPLLEIAGDPGLQLAAPADAGLYHTAFLLPERSDLGRWILHAVEREIPVDGVADHLVSEAIYLTDPEGNGVEIYADRPADTWVWNAGQIQMATDPLDVQALLALAPPMEPPIYVAPAGTMIGHVHLKVGNAAEASRWWQDELRLDAVRERDGAAFLSTGQYHHHIATNQWQSAGAGPLRDGFTGLSFVEMSSRNPVQVSRLVDPWGIEVRVSAV